MNLTKFIVFADLHVDIMHDSLKRTQAVIDAATRAEADFIVSLGDITYPENRLLESANITERHKKAFRCDRDDEKREIMSMLRNCGIPFYQVMGNHDSDPCPHSFALEYMGLERGYYSFDSGGFHFAVLDSNYIYDEKYIPYENCNYHYYYGKDKNKLPFLPDEQIDWLRDEVLATDKPTVLFSHQSLTTTGSGIKNIERFREVIGELNADGPRVILALNGHTHIDRVIIQDGVPFIDINSISNHWMGSPYESIKYSEEIDKTHPYLKRTAPYLDPLLALVELSPGSIKITGTESEFVGKTPAESGFGANNSFICPRIADKFFLYNGDSWYENY